MDSANQRRVALLLSALCILTSLLIIVATAIDMFTSTITFIKVTLGVYLIVIGFALFAIDLKRPVVCFVETFWGRGLLYLFLGMIVYNQGAEFSQVSGIIVIIVAFIFILLAALDKFSSGCMGGKFETVFSS